MMKITEVEPTKWTQFWDMHSGGGTKEAPYDKIYIEASEDEAIRIFYNRFGHNPQRVTCTCCGEDYSISESDSLAQATGYHRNCDWPKGEEGYTEEARTSEYSDHVWKHITLEDYLKKETVLVIYADDIEPEERKGDVPNQGYVWMD